MTEHAFCELTWYCKKCGVLKGYHALECLATPNVLGFMHHLKQRQMKGESTSHGLDYPPTKGFPKPPPVSA
jgi:hypothetical protein